MREDYEPFENAEEVWFWFCNSVTARGDGLRAKGDYLGHIRICEISDIYKIIKKMKSGHYISNRHLRIMSKWGSLSTAPYYDRRAKRSEIALWEEGMRYFEIFLKTKGIL